MTIDEFGQFASAIKTYFPKDNLLSTNEAMDLWFDMLKDLDYQRAYIGLKTYVAINKFPPAISDIRAYAMKVKELQELNEMEAWSLVKKAIRNGGYNSIEEYEKLPLLIQKAVGLPSQLREWALDENYKEAVVMSNFQKAYKFELQKKQEFQKLPQQVQKFIEEENKNSYSTKIEQKRQEMIESANAKKQSEIMALEIKLQGVPMPDKYRQRLEKMQTNRE